MSDRLTVILPPIISDEERKQALLRSCWRGVFLRADTDGLGNGYSWRYGLSSCGDGFGCEWEDGDGFGDGYGDGDGEGESSIDV